VRPRRRLGDRLKKGTATLELWRRLVGELGGEVETTGRGKPTRAVIPFRNWTVVLDIFTQSHGDSSSTYTRARSLFQRQIPFTLRVTKRNLFHRFAPLVGLRGISLGYSRLDQAVFVRSDHPSHARAMLRGTSLGAALIADPPGRLLVIDPGKRIRRVTGDSVGEVQLLRGGQQKDLARLRSIVQLSMATLDQLERLKLATANPVEGVAI
jgi:hypothetical protein